MLLVLLLLIFFFFGYWISSAQTDTWRALLLTPEPEVCRLCAQPHSSTFLLSLSTGSTIELNAEQNTCVTLHLTQAPLAPELFCRNCRARLAQTQLHGYVLLDGQAQPYPLQTGAAYQFPGCRICITKGDSHTLVVEASRP